MTNRYLYEGDVVRIMDRGDICKCELCGDPVWIAFMDAPGQYKRVQRSELFEVK